MMSPAQLFSHIYFWLYYQGPGILLCTKGMKRKKHSDQCHVIVFFFKTRLSITLHVQLGYDTSRYMYIIVMLHLFNNLVLHGLTTARPGMQACLECNGSSTKLSVHLIRNFIRYLCRCPGITTDYSL